MNTKKHSNCLLISLTFLLFIVLFFETTAFTYTQKGGGMRGYYQTVQSDTTIVCLKKGGEKIPKFDEDWQILTKETTKDGNKITWKFVNQEVTNDMLENNVPDRSWGDKINIDEEWKYFGEIVKIDTNEETNELIVKTAKWQALTLKDYTYTVTIEIKTLSD